MSITTIQGSLLPVRRDGQIAGGSSVSLGGNSGTGTGGGLGSMSWPTAAGIAVYDGSNAWGASITDSSADWNAAYGWGDHALAGYLDAATGIAYDSYRLGGALANTFAPLASPTFTGTVSISTDGYTTTHLSFIDTHAGGRTWYMGPETGTGDVNSFSLYDVTAAETRLTIDNNGNVLIGQTSGSEKLCVTGNILVTTGSVKSESLESITTFSSGFAGDGYKVIETGGISSLEVDTLRVRGTLSVYELQINKISSVNGGMIISIANAKCTTVSGTTIYFDEGGGLAIPFVVGDYIKAQQFTGTGVAAYLGHVTAVNAGNVVATQIGAGTPWNGMDLVQFGNSNTGTYPERQNAIYLTAADTNNPYIAGYAGVTDGIFTGHEKFRLGNLTGITDATLSPSGYGLYAQNVFLSGKIVASSGTIGGFIITATELYAGSGATRVEMQAAGGFWAGADTFAAAQFSVSPAGVMKALGVAEFGTGNGSSVGNIALKFNRISNNGYNGLDDIVINYDGYAAGITQFRSLSIYDGKNNIIGAFDGPSKSLIMTGDLDCNGVVDFIGSPYVKLSQQHPMVTGATDITCSASETDMNAMSITVTPKGNRMFIMFSAPFYVSSANQTLNLYINVDGSDDAHTTTYIGSGFQAVSFQYIAPVTPGTPCIIKVRWLGSTSIEQRGSTDAKRVLTVMDLM